MCHPQFESVTSGSPSTTGLAAPAIHNIRKIKEMANKRERNWVCFSLFIFFFYHKQTTKKITKQHSHSRVAYSYFRNCPKLRRIHIYKAAACWCQAFHPQGVDKKENEFFLYFFDVAFILGWRIRTQNGFGKEEKRVVSCLNSFCLTCCMLKPCSHYEVLFYLAYTAVELAQLLRPQAPQIQAQQHQIRTQLPQIQARRPKVLNS